MCVLLQSAPAFARDAPQASHDDRCAALLEQASGYLGDAQYPALLRVSEERQRQCPGPVSAFLVGLAQGNMVEHWVEEDPARRELLRRQAVQHLQVATAGGHALRPVWRFTAHDWLVHLRGMAPDHAVGQTTGYPTLAASHGVHAAAFASEGS